MIKYVVALSNGKKQKIVNRRRTIRDYNFIHFQIDSLNIMEKYPKYQFIITEKNQMVYLMVVMLLVVLKDVMCLKHFN